MTQNVAAREEKIRDLSKQVTELEGQAETEVVFQEISPRRAPVTIYSTTDGEPIAVPLYMVRAAMSATRADGKLRFAGRKEDVPEYKLGEIKCFLHPDSPERPILEKIGLAGTTCAAPHLASGHSKRMHSEHRHKHEWAALQEYLNDQKEKRRESRADEQLAATLALAQRAATPGVETPAAPAPQVCQGCGEAIEGALADHQCK